MRDVQTRASSAEMADLGRVSTETSWFHPTPYTPEAIASCWCNPLSPDVHERHRVHSRRSWVPLTPYQLTDGIILRPHWQFCDRTGYLVIRLRY
eukprot:4453039-Heterocapsa_arctica.AAC.1